jgi:1,4-alpha-glucan branching enzyme
LVIACNFTPVVRHNYRLGVQDEAAYREILNSDAREFGGSGLVNESLVLSSDTGWHSQPYSIEFSLPPLAVVIFSKENLPD